MGEDAGKEIDAGFAARCLLRSTCWGTLATQCDGQPSAALVTQAIAPDGAVLMLLSAMSDHARHLTTEPRCALMVTGKPENLNWQTAPRLTVSGRAERVEDAQDSARPLRRYWVSHHPYAKLYADFTDFSVWRMVPEAGLFVAGFGRINPLTADCLRCDAASVAALAAGQAAVVARCNRELGAGLSRLAHAAGQSGRWSMLGVDPDGFDLAQDETVLRIAFDAPVQDATSALDAVSRLIKSERSGDWLG